MPPLDWLPTSFGRFCPDFVRELTDGRVFVAGYKGEHLRDVAREIEKGWVGRLWAERSGDLAVPAMVFKLERGMHVRQQLDAVLARPNMEQHGLRLRRTPGLRGLPRSAGCCARRLPEVGPEWVDRPWAAQRLGSPRFCR